MHDLVRWAWRPVGAMRLRRAVRRAGGSGLRVVVGAGPRRLPGWLNTDVSPRAGLYLDATRPWPTPAGSVAYVYGDNVIEHFALADARAALRYAHLALAPGGVLRLATPDVGAIASLYVEGGAAAAAALERNRACGYEVTHPVDLLRLALAGEHANGYAWDHAALAAELSAAGFIQLARWGVGDSDDPVLRGLEARTGPTERLTTLVVEARKPWN